MPAIKWNQRKMSRLASLPVTVGITNRAVVTWCIDPLREFQFLQIAASQRRRLGGVPKTGYGWIRRQVCSCCHNDVNSRARYLRMGPFEAVFHFSERRRDRAPFGFSKSHSWQNRPEVGNSFFIFLLSLGRAPSGNQGK